MLVSTRLVGLIEKNADELTQKWLNIVTSHDDLPTYRVYDKKKLYDRAFRVYSQLGKWISSETTKEDIEKQYKALGSQRRREGFGLNEVIQALIITRRVLWLKVQSDGFLDNALSLKIALDLNNTVILFFDRAIYYSAQGYEQES